MSTDLEMAYDELGTLSISKMNDRDTLKDEGSAERDIIMYLNTT